MSLQFMGSVRARKAALCLAAYLLVIVPLMALIFLGLALDFENGRLGAGTQQTVFMLVLNVCFLALMLLVIRLGVSLRTEAEHTDEKWPPRIIPYLSRTPRKGRAFPQVGAAEPLAATRAIVNRFSVWSTDTGTA